MKCINYIQVRFIRLIPIDLFRNCLHTPETIYAFFRKQLRSLDAIFNSEMSSAKETGLSCLFLPLVILYMLTVMPVITDISKIAAMHFKFISCDTDGW